MEKSKLQHAVEKSILQQSTLQRSTLPLPITEKLPRTENITKPSAYQEYMTDSHENEKDMLFVDEVSSYNNAGPELRGEPDGDPEDVIFVNNYLERSIEEQRVRVLGRKITRKLEEKYLQPFSKNEKEKRNNQKRR